MRHQHDHRRIAAREMLRVAGGAAPQMAALLALRRRAAHPAIAVARVPEGEAAGIGAKARLARRQRGADAAQLDVAAARRDDPELGREQAGAGVGAQEQRVVRQRPAELGDRRQQRAGRLARVGDHQLQLRHQEHAGGRIGAPGREPCRIEAVLGRPIQVRSGVDMRRWIDEMRHRGSRFERRPAHSRRSSGSHQPRARPTWRHRAPCAGRPNHRY